MSDTTDLVQYARPADSELEQWARDLHQAYQAARSLVTTSFVPQSYKAKPEEAAAAIMTGAELGLSPLAALRSIDIIQGTPALRAIAMRALVQSKGHDIWVEESTETRAIVCGRRQGSDHVERVVWSQDRAQRLGLMSKDNYRKQPGVMYIARGTGEVARLIAADVLLGVPYTVEEIQDGIDQGMPVEVEPKRARRTVKRATLPETVTPDLPAEETLPDPETEPVDPEAAYEEWPTAEAEA